MNRLYLHLLRLILILWLGLVPVEPSFAYQGSCPDRFVAISQYADRIGDPAKTFAEDARIRLLKKSDAITADLQAATKAGKPKKVEMVIIGGGPHSTEIYSSFHSTNPNLKALIFEKTEEVGTFDRFGSSFSLNSAEFADATGNTIYGSSIKVKHFNPEGAKYVPAERMGDVTLGAHLAADSPLAFKQEVTEILERPAGANWPARYKVKTANGVEVYTDVVVAAPGMGNPWIRVKDPASLALAATEKAKSLAAAAKGEVYLPLVETLDDSLERARNLARQGENFLDYYPKNERVGVIGAGYGSMISVEALAGVSPERLYPGIKGKAPSDLKIVWLGQTSDTFEKFKVANTNQRYWPTMEQAYAGNHIVAQPGRVVSWRPVRPDEAHLGKLAVTLEGQDTPVYLDRLVTGTGYDNRVADMFQTLVPPSVAPADRAAAVELKLVSSTLDQNFTAAPTGETVTAKQVSINGRDQEIYVAGQATGFEQGKELPADEWKAAKGGFLDVIGRRSEALGRDIAQKVGGGIRLIRF